jgi:hypothetical protein
MQFYTYIYKDPRTDTPVYVGKGVRDRAYKHKFNKKTDLGKLLIELDLLNIQCDPIIVYHKNELTSLCMEIFWIAVYGREDIDTGTLFNKTAGGPGWGAGTNRKPLSQETRDKISTKATGRYHSQETKDKLSKISTGNTNRRGDSHSEESKQKIRDARKSQTFSDETREKLKISATGRFHTDETKLKMKRPKSDEARKNMSGRIISDEQKAKVRATWAAKKLNQTLSDGLLV